MLGKIIFLSAALLAFIVFGIVSCFAQTKLTEFVSCDHRASTDRDRPVAGALSFGDAPGNL